MCAVRYHRTKRPLKLDEVTVPTAGQGQVVVQAKAAGLCHIELHFLSGLLNLGVHPVTLGHEVSPWGGWSWYPSQTGATQRRSVQDS